MTEEFRRSNPHWLRARIGVDNARCLAWLSSGNSSQSEGLQPQHRKKSRHLLSGLLRCGACGTGMSVKDRVRGRVRIRCTRMIEAGTCDKRRIHYLDAIERAVLGGLSEKLTDCTAIEY